MAVKVEDIRKANEEYYCSTYSNLSLKRKSRTIIYTIVILLFIEIIAFLIKCSVVWMNCLERGKSEVLENIELIDWALDQVIDSLGSLSTLAMIVFSAIIVLFLICFYYKEKSYTIYKKSRMILCFTVFLIAMEFIVVCTLLCFIPNELGVDGLIPIVITLLEVLLSYLPYLLAFRVFLPSSLKVPLDVIFDWLSKFIVEQR